MALSLWRAADLVVRSCQTCFRRNLCHEKWTLAGIAVRLNDIQLAGEGLYTEDATFRMYAATSTRMLRRIFTNPQ